VTLLISTMTAEGRSRPIPGFALLYATILVTATGSLAMMSLVPAIARSSGIPDVAMVAVQSASAGLSILAMPFWAARSDRVGRKPVIMIGITGFTVASALTAGAIFAAVDGLVSVAAGIAALVAARAVFGSVGLAAAPAIQAHIADETTPGRRTSALASIFSAQGIGSIVGPGIAPALAQTYTLVVLAYVLSSAGGAFAMPAAASGASLANPRDMQGTVTGLTTAATSSGLLIAPVIAMLIYRHSPASAFVSIAVAVAGVAILLLPRLLRTPVISW
jgi:MFS family permease